MAVQGRIDTDWLRADWHTEEPPRRRPRRRNVLPEAYRRLPEPERRQVRAAARWIRERVSHVDWGRKMRDEEAGKPVPKPVNLKEQVRPYLAGNWGSGVRKLTLAAVIRHLVGDDTAYFTANSLGDETLLMVDINCHSRGTLEGATQFAERLKRDYFPDLYYEVSTHGNGIQGFVVVDRSCWKDADYKATIQQVEKWLKRVLRNTTFDVEDVELKGTPLVVTWGRRRREVAGVTFGLLAKMPRDWRRLAEWRSTTRMTAHDLRRLPERFPAAEPEPEPQQQRETPVRKVAKGSVSGKLVDPEVIRQLEPLARELLRLGTPKVTGSSRAVVVAEDVQVTLAVLRACTLDMNADGSMPVMRVKAIWDAAYRAGDTSRAFSFRRFAAIRDMLSDMGLLEWEDETYSFGKACKWRASGKLMAMIEKATIADTTTNSSSLSILVCNSVEEARQAPRPGRSAPEKGFPVGPEGGLGREAEAGRKAFPGWRHEGVPAGTVRAERKKGGERSPPSSNLPRGFAWTAWKLAMSIGESCGRTGVGVIFGRAVRMVPDDRTIVAPMQGAVFPTDLAKSTTVPRRGCLRQRSRTAGCCRARDGRI